jgi:hypothetical protein
MHNACLNNLSCDEKHFLLKAAALGICSSQYDSDIPQFIEKSADKNNDPYLLLRHFFST